MSRPVCITSTYHYAGSENLVCTISALGNPVLWWGSIPALLYAAWQGLIHRRRTAGFLLVGFLSAYLPWVLVSRLTFIYHYFTALPFALLALLLVLDRWDAASRRGRRVSDEHRALAPKLVMSGLVVASLALFVVFFPVISGYAAPADYVKSLQWLPGWFFCG